MIPWASAAGISSRRMSRKASSDSCLRRASRAISLFERPDLEAEVLPQPDLLESSPAIDPDDLPHLAAAAAGGAEIFVTGDRELLALESFHGVPIRAPRAAWPLLG
jgi:predicted nucleic acid-binding protein